MIRAFAAWSWLVSATGAAVMVVPHLPLLLAQQAVIGFKRSVTTEDAVVRTRRPNDDPKAVERDTAR